MTSMNRANHKNLILSLLIFCGIILYETLKGFNYLKNNIEYEKSNFNVVLDGGDVRRKCIGTGQAFCH